MNDCLSGKKTEREDNIVKAVSQIGTFETARAPRRVDCGAYAHPAVSIDSYKTDLEDTTRYRHDTHIIKRMAYLDIINHITLGIQAVRHATFFVKSSVSA